MLGLEVSGVNGRNLDRGLGRVIGDLDGSCALEEGIVDLAG